MLLKEHEQVSVAWTTQRGQRCLGFAILFAVLITFALLGQTALPKGTELRFDTLSDMAYSSTPEAGKPRLPFPDNSIRKAADEPWFWLEEEDDGTEVYAELEAQEEPIDPSRQELEKTEGTLIGLL